LKEKGWFEDAYIAMDERAPEDVKKIIALIQKKAPGMKVAMAGNKSPSEFSGMKIDNYCQGLIHLRKHPKLMDELEPRRQKGCKTTFYVCATAMHPNTFMDSNLDEGFWLGAYPGAIGFDGFLRWAANSWPKNPYDDASFKTVRRGNLQWRPGDTFLIYPGGELSSRLIALRAGVVAAEKMWILKNGARGTEKRKEIEKSLKKLAAPYGYKGAIRNAFDFSAFRRAVEEFVNSQHVAFSLCAVGDSITQGGSNFVAHRIALENRFDKLGWDVKWMGSRSDASWGSKNPCEGYGGHNAESIASKYQVNAASITADVLLLHAGNNYNVGDTRLTPAPMSESAIITAVTNAHARIIASARAQNPEVVVLYAKVITSGGNRGLKYSYIPNLNKAIGVLADELNTSKSPVISVDMAAGWNYAVDCVADCVHPNAVGAAKMADKWMAAISPFVDEGRLSVGSSGQ
jgi:hypothetical protein